jgi:hypothetical protein
MYGIVKGKTVGSKVPIVPAPSLFLPATREERGGLNGRLERLNSKFADSAFSS